MDCKTLYLFRNTTEPYGDAAGYALCECGEPVASHVSSSLDWARHDLGYENSTWKHERYAEHCPDGYELVWVACDSDLPGFVEALRRNSEMGGEE